MSPTGPPNGHTKILPMSTTKNSFRNLTNHHNSWLCHSAHFLQQNNYAQRLHHAPQWLQDTSSEYEAHLLLLQLGRDYNCSNCISNRCEAQHPTDSPAFPIPSTITNTPLQRHYYHAIMMRMILIHQNKSQIVIFCTWCSAACLLLINLSHTGRNEWAALSWYLALTIAGSLQSAFVALGNDTSTNHCSSIYLFLFHVITSQCFLAGLSSQLFGLLHQI